MVTRPRPTDPVAMFTRNDGTTEAHGAGDHSRVIDLPVNAKKYLRGDGGLESGSAVTAFAAEANASGGAYIPKGTYTIPDSTSLFASLSADVVIAGAGRNKTMISTKDAYAFAAPATGALDRVAIRDLSTSLRSGSTSGGGIKAVSDSYHAGWDIAHVDCHGVAGNTDTLIRADGFIGSHIRECLVTVNGGDGVSVTSSGFVSNASTLDRVTASACGQSASTYAGIRVVGGSHIAIVYGDSESNHCYGIYLDDVIWPILERRWFEDNWNHNLFIVNCIGGQIARNKFHLMNGSADGASRHIKITRSASGQRDMHTISCNSFQDAPASGVAIDIGANVEQTSIERNRGTGVSGSSGGGTITNSGTQTRFHNNDNDPFESIGTGSPEGVVPAGAGSTYRRLDGSTGTSFYVKEYGTYTQSNGWVAK